VIYELFIKLLGPNLAAVLTLLLQEPQVAQDQLRLSAVLASPVTQETAALVQQHFTFSVDYAFSLIVNERKTFRLTARNSLSYDGGWKVNGQPVDAGVMQTAMGAVAVTLPACRFDEGDVLLVFVKASIVPDADFERSTELKTSILWRYFEPKAKRTYLYTKGRFVAQ
jgi:hypothetical protein